MLPKVELIKKLHNNINFTKQDFKKLDSIYFMMAADLKSILDCPIYKAHTNEMFKMFATYYLHRLHNLRTMLHNCAKSRCIDYASEPVWKPISVLTKEAWDNIKDLICYTQDPEERYFQEDAETRMAIRQIVSDIQILMKEFRIICGNYYNKIPDNVNSIIQIETVEDCGPHVKNCPNFFCDFKV